MNVNDIGDIPEDILYNKIIIVHGEYLFLIFDITLFSKPMSHDHDNIL